MRDGGTVDARKVARCWLVLPALGLALAGAACGEDLGTGGSGTTFQVSVQDNFFSPALLTVPLNSTVTFVWGGVIAHDVTYFAGPAPLPPSSFTMTSGIFRTTFTRAGTFDYVCTLHPGMGGRIIVTP